MRRIHTNYYSCRLLSDIVLPKKIATEVNLDVLDFIPGAVFRGVIAKSVFEEGTNEQIKSVLFNGDTVFSDARLQIDNKASLKIPLDWAHEKGKSKDIGYVKSELDEVDRTTFQESNVQLKEYKQGYFQPEKDTHYRFQKVRFQAHPKSARNQKTGSSKDGQLFIYKSISEGQQFGFYVSTSSKENLTLIDTLLTGIKYVGKSRKAEFGQVKITRIDETRDERISEKNYSGSMKLYFASRCCFVNEYGYYTGTPRVKEDLLLNEEATINWGKSTIRTERFAPWNGHRRALDAERICWLPGSVLVIDNIIDHPVFQLEKGIGVHQSEGFGEVLVNPSFLSVKDILLTTDEKKFNSNKAVSIPEKYQGWVEILKSRKAPHQIDIKSLAYDFQQQYELNFRGLSSNQWNSLKVNKGIKTVQEKLSPLTKGIAQTEWSEKDRLIKLNDFVNTIVCEDPKRTRENPTIFYHLSGENNVRQKYELC